MKAIHFQLLRPIAAALLGSLIAVGCANNATTTDTTTATTEGATTTSSTQDKPSNEPFLVGYNQWIGSVGVFLAKEKGYFKDAGLNVEMKQFAGPADSVPPLIAGQLDAALTTADTPILLSKEANSNPLTNVFITDTSAGADAVVAQAGINSLKDLKGKTVAATKGQCNELLLMKGLRSAV
jgi:NitT/TauT family transport system substrate-binding protein